MSHYHSSQGIEIEGQRSRSRCYCVALYSRSDV